jgi:tRNA dimethylallyltransferase
LIRALELAGAGVAARERTWPAPRTGPRITGLALPQQALQARIEARTRRMFAAGLLEETRTLLGQGLKAAPTAAQAIGYAEALKVLEGGWTIEEAVAAVALRTRHLAKRQLTWFRHQANVDWLEVAPDQPVADCARQVLAYWETHGSTPIAGL